MKPHLRLHCRMPSTSQVYGNIMTPEDRQWRVSGAGIETHWHLYSGNAIKKASAKARYIQRAVLREAIR